MIPVGCGKLPDKADKASVNVFHSIIFMGEPCAKNSAGIRFLFIMPVPPFICLQGPPPSTHASPPTRTVSPCCRQQLSPQMRYRSFCQYCLLYTSDAADEEDSVDLGGRRI